MFNNLGWGEIGFLLVLALFVLGPERLPKVAADAGRLLRQLRQMAKGATEDLKSELGPELADLDLTSLHPKRFVAKHLFADEDEQLFSDDEQTAPTPVGLPAQPRLAVGERPPYDPDAT